jgi:hypothetical protein
LFFGGHFADFLSHPEANDENVTGLKLCALPCGYGLYVGGADAVPAEGGVLDVMVVGVGFIVD